MQIYVCMDLPTYVCVIVSITTLFSLFSLHSQTIVSSLFEGFNMSGSPAHHAHYTHTHTNRAQTTPGIVFVKSLSTASFCSFSFPTSVHSIFFLFSSPISLSPISLFFFLPTFFFSSFSTKWLKTEKVIDQQFYALLSLPPALPGLFSNKGQ